MSRSRRAVANVPLSTEKMTVAVTVPAMVNRQATADTREVTQLPQRLQMERMPRRSSTAVTVMAMMYPLDIHSETRL
jgi:hypothetical protein